MTVVPVAALVVVAAVDECIPVPSVLVPGVLGCGVDTVKLDLIVAVDDVAVERPFPVVHGLSVVADDDNPYSVEVME